MYTNTPHYCLKQERFAKLKSCYRNKAHYSQECIKHSSDRQYNSMQSVSNIRPWKRKVKNGGGGGSMPTSWGAYGKKIAVKEKMTTIENIEV